MSGEVATDMNTVRVMDRRYIDEHHVIARYLADRMTDDERSEFETYYVDHPEVVEEMEAAARFKVGLMRLRDTGELASLLRSKPRYLQWQFLAAAAVVIVLVLGWLYEFSRPAHTQSPLIAATLEAMRTAKGSTPSRVGVYAILRTRSGSVDAEIAPSEPGQAVELRVLPEFTAEPARYRVQLSRMDADDSLEFVAGIGGLVPAPDRFVSVFLSGARLKPGQYQLAIRGETNTDAQDKESVFVVRVASSRR
jgi:hypothetical protein